MDQYIIVTTLTDKESIALKIQDELLKKNLVAGVQMAKVKSKYWWNNEIEEREEFHLEMRTKKSLYKIIEKIIKGINDYDVCEISYYEINGSKDFLNWQDAVTKGI